MPTVTAEIEKVPKLNVLTTENSIMGKETKMPRELVGGTKSFHEMGEVNRVESVPGNMLSIRRKEVADRELQQKATEGGMQWETTTTQEENSKFLSKMRQSSIEAVPEESAKTLEGEIGPIAMIYDKEEGWTGEILGPQSKHWKRLARKAPTKAQKEEAGPVTSKRESPMPLQELGCQYH